MCTHSKKQKTQSAALKWLRGEWEQQGLNAHLALFFVYKCGGWWVSACATFKAVMRSTVQRSPLFYEATWTN